MDLKSIISNRLFSNEVFWQIVYEWEDIIAKELCLKVKYNFLNLTHKRFISGVLYGILRMTEQHVPITSDNSISFIMTPTILDGNICSKKSIIPAIIDFWLSTDEEFDQFKTRYQNNPAVLITSKEAYDIIARRCPEMRIFHWPLSLPDSWLDDLAPSPKRWDCAVVGRPNSVLNEWMHIYASRHSDFTYVINMRQPNLPCNYVSSNGKTLGNVFYNRDTYHQFLKSVRVGLYSTPGKDNSRQQFKGCSSHGYNQVTPRFLEYLSAGCHVLSRYDKNPDTDFYNLDSISPNIETYQDFEMRMDIARSHAVDYKKYRDYLSMHTTSNRAKLLRQILNQIRL